MTLVHWDDVEGVDIPERSRPLGGSWQHLGDAAGSARIGVHRIRFGDGMLVTPPHVHSAEEEIYYVLDGSALLWQDGHVCAIEAGDAMVFVPNGPVHTLIGNGECEVLIFGERLRTESGVLPRTNAAWLGRSPVRVLDEHPWRAEAALGLPESEPGPRPANLVASGELEGEYGGIEKHLGDAAGASRTGLNLFALPPNEEAAAPHCHSADEEAFVVLDGEGLLELWGPPLPGAGPPTEPTETHALRRGHVVARRAGSRVSHCLRAGPNGLTYLAYGTREPDDVRYYPRSNKISFRGLGVIARLELLDYFDGEPA